MSNRAGQAAHDSIETGGTYDIAVMVDFLAGPRFETALHRP